MEYEYATTFVGHCTCPENCPNFDDNLSHGWGSCGAYLPDGSDCPCEAGWEE